MRKFVISVLKLLALTLTFMVVLDAIFTYTYYSCSPRNKMQYIMKIEPRKIDYLFLGSSRVVNHILPEEVESLTGKSALNLGIEGATLTDNALQLELLIDRKVKIKTLFLQVDYIFNYKKASDYVLPDVLPYIHEPIINKYVSENRDYAWRYRMAPFFRYMTADYVIGIRSIFQNFRANASVVTHRGGFKPRGGPEADRPTILPDFVAEENESLNKIKELCTENGIELVLYFSPVCSRAENLDYSQKLKKRLPELMDYSRFFPNDDNFGDCRHLREDGARIFTRRLMTDYLNQKQTH